MSSVVVPIGKYKGQPVEVMLADTSYCEWFAAQPWAQERHVAIYNIITGARPDISETPEHNALQAKFLDDAFLLKVVDAFGGGYFNTFQQPAKERAIDQYRDRFADLCAWVKAAEAMRKKLADPDRSYSGGRDDGPNYSSRADSLTALHAALQRVEDALPKIEALSAALKTSQPPVVGAVESKRMEEVGYDVLAKINLSCVSTEGELCKLLLPAHGEGWPHYENYSAPTRRSDNFTFSSKVRRVLNLFVVIEIKPSIGDDYPEILRQMKRSFLTLRRSFPTPDLIILYTREIRCQLVTADAVKAIFALEKIHVVVDPE